MRHTLAGLVGLAAVVALVLNWREVRDQAADLSAPAVLAAGGLAVAALWASMLAWRAILRDLGSPLRVSDGSRLFFLAQLAKYVPGGFWPVLTHMELGRDHEIPRHRTGAAFAVMSTLTVLTGIAIAAATLPLTAGDAAVEYAALLVAVPVLAALLHPRALGWVLDRALRRLGREPLARPPSWRGVLVATAWVLAMWLLFGAHAWVLARELGGDGAELAPLALGAFAASWAAGFLFVIAPAGFGVRDAALVVLLGTTLGASAAAALAVSSRLLLTVADLAVAAGALALARHATDR